LKRGWDGVNIGDRVARAARGARVKKVVVAKGTHACAAVALGVLAVGLSSGAMAASQVSVGGYHDEALRAAQRSLTRDAEDSLGEFSVGGVRISVDTGDGSAVTGFTPRFGGLGLGRSSAADPGEVGALLKTRLDPEEAEPAVRREVRVGPETGAEVAGLEVNWAAIAEVDHDQSLSLSDPDESHLLVGGELALSGVRVDASVGQEPDLLGLDGNRVSAGLGYEFGALGARLGYSLVEEETTAETSLFTLGSRLNLRPGLIVQGDLAYARGEEGEPATAGVVSFRFSF
jgi:Gram-negative porin